MTRSTRVLRPVTVLPVIATDHWRPQTRGDCATVQRPCVYVGCKHNLFLDVKADGRTIVLNFPGKEPEDMTHSCALDVADGGGETLNSVARTMGVSKQAIQQCEDRALVKMAKNGRRLREFR
jgi:hypothetical protein